MGPRLHRRKYQRDVEVGASGSIFLFKEFRGCGEMESAKTGPLG